MPPDVVLDMTFDRTLFMVHINPGAVGLALEKAGMKPTIEYGERVDTGNSIRLDHNFEAGGVAYRCEVGNLGLHTRQFASEFLSLAGFVEIARALIQNTKRLGGQIVTDQGQQMPDPT